MEPPFVWIANEDGTVRAVHCKMGMSLSKNSLGPVTHAAVFWYDDQWDDSTGAYHIVPIDSIFYECDEPEENPRPVAYTKPEIIVTRQTIPESLRNEIFERDGYKCVICGSTHNLQIDHFYPFSKGGKTEKSNLQTLCKTCNVKKGNKVE
jgi:hypothetical protein